ncbi:hypothetical protein GC163_00260 [bacterium]|nr:hypothetical protein [bacterium]
MSASLLAFFTVDQVAWMLIHFLWQGVLIAALGWAVIVAGRFRQPSTRYAVWLSTLVVMAAMPLLTLGLTAPSRNQIAGTSVVTEPETRTVQQLLNELIAGLQTSETEASAVVAQLQDATLDETGDVTSSLWEQWPTWVVAVWSLGVCLCSMRLVGAATWMWCLIRRSEPVSQDVQAAAERLCMRLGLSRLPRLLASPAVREPLALYWLRPMILLPASWLADVSPGVLEAVLAHELAHIRRYDLWINLWQRIVETLLFFHPCIWWVSKQIRVERELCCDAEAVRATGLPVQYAQALELVARQRWACASPQLAVGIGGTRMALLHRVKQVLGVESSAAESQWWTLGLAGVGITAACWMGLAMWSAPVQGEDTEPVALADGEREPERDLRPAPPPRREGREEGDRPRPPEGDRPRPEGPRDEPRPPRGPEREEGPRPPGPPEGRDGDRGPRPEGRGGERPPRPIPEIVEELARAMRELDERGPEGMREKQQLMAHLLQTMSPHMGHMGPPMMGESLTDRVQRADVVRPRNPEEPMRAPMAGLPPAHPPMLEMQRDMLNAMRELRQEVERLRDEVNDIRERRPPGPRGDMLGPDHSHNRGEGRPGRPPEGRDGPPPRGPREGEAGPPRGPRDGEGPPPRSPRDGEAGPPRGPREEGDRRPPREEEGEPRAEVEQPVSAENRDA